jgi:ATP-dependent DNA ligase
LLPTVLRARNKHFNGLIYLAFDLLYLDGYDLRNVPLIERKPALELIGEAGRERIGLALLLGQFRRSFGRAFKRPMTRSAMQ